MEEQVKFKIHGYIKAWQIKDDVRTLVLSRRNAIVGNAKNIVAHCLGGDSAYKIDEISVHKVSTQLAAVTPVLVSYPAFNEVRFNARFTHVSFNDTVDELNLSSSIHGKFSEKIGVSIFKDDTMELEIQWTLTINSLQ